MTSLSPSLRKSLSPKSRKSLSPKSRKSLSPSSMSSSLQSSAQLLSPSSSSTNEILPSTKSIHPMTTRNKIANYRDLNRKK